MVLRKKRGLFLTINDERFFLYRCSEEKGDYPFSSELLR